MSRMSAEAKHTAREAFIAAHAITTNSGEYRSREQVIETVAARLRRHRVAGASDFARAFVDDPSFMRRHHGETAGSIARAVADALVHRWYTKEDRS